MEYQFKTPTPTEVIIEEALRIHVNLQHEQTIFFLQTDIKSKTGKLPSKKALGPEGIINSVLKHYDKMVIK